MAVRYTDTVSGNDRYLQQQIHRIVGAVLGPVSVGPDEGEISMYSDAGDTVEITPVNGLTAYPDGVRTHLNPWMVTTGGRISAAEAKNAEQDGRLTSAEGRIGKAEERIGKAEGRLDGHDRTLSSHGTRIGNVESKNASQDSTISGIASRVSSLEGKSTVSPGELSDLRLWVQAQLAALERRIIALEEWKNSLY